MMVLDPKAKALLTAMLTAGNPAISTLPADVARKHIESRFAQMRTPVKPVGRVENIQIHGPCNPIDLRIYSPPGDGPFPVIVFFHGGGWVLFGLDAYDSICTHLCAETPCTVVSVAYRLAPENKFPAATDDCLSATKWVIENAGIIKGESSKIFVAGDSAGGNLAAVTTQRLRETKQTTLAGQILIYPVTDYYLPATKSYLELGRDYNLTENDLTWFWDQYLADEQDSKNPFASPLKASTFESLPPALVIVAGFDPLRDEGLAYAKKLQQAKIPVKISVYEDMMHGFISYLGILRQAQTAIKEISDWITSQ